MEMASMLAAEPFSDHPPSVCPSSAHSCGSITTRSTTTGAWDLYAHAAKVVITRERGRMRRALRPGGADAAAAHGATPVAAGPGASPLLVDARPRRELRGEREGRSVVAMATARRRAGFSPAMRPDASTGRWPRTP